MTAWTRSLCWSVSELTQSSPTSSCRRWTATVSATKSASTRTCTTCPSSSTPSPSPLPATRSWPSKWARTNTSRSPPPSKPSSLRCTKSSPKPHAAPRPDALREVETLKNYNERLVSKLKEKNTELQAQTEALCDSEERFRTLVET